MRADVLALEAPPADDVLREVSSRAKTRARAETEEGGGVMAELHFCVDCGKRLTNDLERMCAECYDKRRKN